MPRFFAEPAQTRDDSQQLRTEGGFSVTFILPPQGFDLVEPAILLLDLFPGAKAAYSLRLLRSLYEGPAIRVKRTSDNTELDIGFFPNGNLDTIALEAFVGSSDGLITILYDQSGNDINLDNQPTDSKLPRIVIAGITQTSMDRPSLFFDGINDDLLSTISLSSPASNLFIFSVWQKLLLTNQFANYNFNFPDDSNRVTVLAPFADGRVIWDAGNNTTDRLATGAGFNDLVQHIWTFFETAGTNNQKIRRDGIQLAQKTPGNPITPVDEIILGNSNNTSGAFANMQFQELVFYDTNELANFVAIENNLMEYWMPTFLNWVNGANNMINGANNLVFLDGP